MHRQTIFISFFLFSFSLQPTRHDDEVLELLGKLKVRYLSLCSPMSLSNLLSFSLGNTNHLMWIYLSVPSFPNGISMTYGQWSLTWFWLDNFG